MNAPGATRKFYPLLDAMRGVAAVLVVMGHASAFFGFRFEEGYLAVDLFFVLSGVVVANAYESALLTSMSLRRFAEIRLVRLYPLYALGLVLGVLDALLWPNPYLARMPFALAVVMGLAIVPRFWPLHHDANPFVMIFPLNFPSWSLFFELAVNFAYAALVRRLSTRLVVAITVGSALAFAWTIHLMHASTIELGTRPRQIPFGILRTTYSFFAGVLIYRLSRHRAPANPSAKAKAASTILILALVTGLLTTQPALLPPALWDLAVITGMFPVIIYWAMSFSYGERTTWIFAFAGMASYSIYVLHSPVSRLVHSLSVRLGFALLPAPWLGVVFLGGMIALSFVVDRVYDRPIRDWLRRLLHAPSGHRPNFEAGAAQRHLADDPRPVSATPAPRCIMPAD